MIEKIKLWFWRRKMLKELNELDRQLVELQDRIDEFAKRQEANNGGI